MNKRICLIILLLNCNICFAQNVFQKAIYGMNLFQAITKPTSDGGYILIGRNVTTLQDEDIFLIKMDSNGDTMWTKTYLINGNQLGGEDVIQTIDGGFFVAAWNYIMKTDSMGQPMWSKAISIGPIWSAYNRACAEATNGDIIVVSAANDSSVPTSKVVLTKLDSAGNLIFMKAFGNFVTLPYPHCVRITSDGGYIIAGESAFSSPTNDAILIKTDSIGTVMWAHKYGGNGSDRFRSVEQTSNGDYLALGTTSLGAGNFFVKVDSVGTLIWARTYNSNGNHCSGGMLTKTFDQNFVFCDDKAMIGKINSNGTVLWAKSYMPGMVSNGKNLNSITETADGGFITSGSYIEVPWDGYIYLIKCDSAGNNPCFATSVSFTQTPVQSKDSAIVCTVSTGILNNVTVIPQCFCDSSNFLCTGVGISENNLPDYINVFPNPFHNRIEITSDKSELSEIILYDISGRKILQQKFSNSTSLNSEQLTNGIYFYEVRCGIIVCKKGKLVKN